jgi:acetyltransferase-like isoleucine patch superfamily enzyme
MTHSENSIIYPGVTWEGEFSLGPFSIVGLAPRGHTPGERPTFIGDGAIINSHTVMYFGNKIGRNFRTGHGVLIREDNQIGDDVSIGSGSNVEHHVRLGNGVRLHSNVFVPELSVLEDLCWLGPNVVLTNAKYPASPTAKQELVGCYVEKGAKIGANTTVLPGIRIGAFALVGAGSVITRDVPAGAVVVGSPARVINEVSKLSAYSKQRTNI